MGILGLLFRGAREAYQERSAKNDLERKLGRKVSKDEVYSLGSHLDAAGANNPQMPLISTPRESSVPFGDAKPPMKTLTKLLLIGIPLAFLGLIFLAAVFMLMPQREYNRLNPFTPKPPEGTFPAKLGTYEIDHKPDYEAPTSYNPATNFESEYKSGSETVRYTLWVYKNEAELNADYAARKKNVTGSLELSKVVDNSDTRYAVATLGGWTSYVLFKDGIYLKQIASYHQQPVLDFEGLLKNAPPAQAVALNEAELKAAAANSKASTTNSNSSTSNSNSSATVLQLLDDYKKDAAAADKKYKDKTIIFTGTAEFADKDKAGKPMVGFMRPGSTKPAEGMVVCSFDKSQEATVLKIKKGDAVKLQGKVFGNILFSVMLENCTKL